MLGKHRNPACRFLGPTTRGGLNVAGQVRGLSCEAGGRRLGRKPSQVFRGPFEMPMLREKARELGTAKTFRRCQGT